MPSLEVAAKQYVVLVSILRGLYADSQVFVCAQGAPLVAVGFVLLASYPSWYACIAVVAMRAVNVITAASKPLLNQLAIGVVVERPLGV